MSDWRIYATDDLSVSVLVDEVDYHHFVRWRWKLSGWGYLCRAIAIGSRKDGTRRASSEYLHVAIMKRVGPPPTPAHVIVDHIDRDLANYRRYNLRWATHSMNVANRAASAWPRGPKIILPTESNLSDTF